MKSLPQKDLYAKIFNSALVAIGTTDTKGNFIAVNPAWCKALGWAEEETNTLNIKDITLAEEQQTLNQELSKLAEGKVCSLRKTQRYKRKDGSFFWADLYRSALFDDKGKVMGILDIFVDIDVQVRSEKVQGELFQSLETLNKELSNANIGLKRQAKYDSLTGLYNRWVMEEMLNKEIIHSLETNRGFAVGIADIDDFKKVNDTYGHDCGDLVLVKLTQSFLQKIRVTDSVCRWGGEEFLFLFSETTESGAMIVVERIRKAIEELTINYKGNQIKVTITIGVSFYNGQDHLDSKELVDRADKAMYEGKNSGKNKAVLYSNIP